MKTISIQTRSSETPLNVLISEYFSSDESAFTWPCAMALAAFIVCHREEYFSGKCVLELGSGCGLPSIVASLIGARHCVLTERSDDERILENLRRSVSANGVDDLCTVLGWDWGSAAPDHLPPVDIVLGSDIFYSSEDFDAVLLSVSCLMSLNQHLVFWTTYQQRSASRSLVPLLDKYRMQAEVVPLSSFLHPCHLEGECLFESSVSVTMTSEEEDKGSHRVSYASVQTFDSVYLIKITSQ